MTNYQKLESISKIDIFTIEKIIAKATQNLSFYEKVKLEQFQLVFRIQEKWKLAVPLILAEHSYPLKLKDRQLIVATDNNIYAQEIHNNQNIISKKIYELTGLSISHIKTKIDKNFWRYLNQEKKSDIINEKETLAKKRAKEKLTPEEIEIQQYLKKLSEELKKQK